MATVDKFTVLTEGTLKVTGRLVDASNATLYATVTLEDQEIVCIYKPIAGERPLWDFADGSLAHREYAAYLVSQALGFQIVPLTILRDGPYGIGMVQEWITLNEEIDLASFFSTDNPSLRSMALFDAIVNNTDRKIGHLLPVSENEVYGCDHGVTFHVEDKLRTVLWQWADDSFTDSEIELLRNAEKMLRSDLSQHLKPFITPAEIDATLMRVERLLSEGKFPLPNPDWPAIPWPAF
ncbi:MAG: SCO1664 family protein [Candidatus Planktophila sp.]|nr:SCO1664 family protein [Candidatus Planktophila sp.]